MALFPTTDVSECDGPGALEQSQTKRQSKGYKLVKANARAERSMELETTLAVAHATVPEWVNAATIMGLIFGGCCSNVSI